MTEPLHPVHTEPSTATAPDAFDVPGDVLSLARSATGLQTPEARATRHERDSAMVDEALSPDGLAVLSTRQLRVMVNQAYKLMDTDCPPAGATDCYEMIVDELEYRAQQATERGSVHQLKETFRDNPLYCRFELIIDGTIAAYVKYTMSGAQIVLLDGVEQPGFRDQGIDEILMRHVVLNAHKRRLSLVPQCPMAFSFLADNPQYRTLTGQTGR
ncbi:GNAT family N-acetyltransferase [Arthrobacter sedimenti]|uniref:GNAT family N-acetyltransferase n=1 Tax=Arthrobacter sedimenti TaxID=2694931 RepID=UPI0014208169|nr:N-acetyltransferase [Arthrobacter sedimenti]